jgi:hypothetical protein
MTKTSQYLAQALALQHAITHAPDTWLPRRDSLLDWLNNFVKRAESASFIPQASEVADLADLQLFITNKKIALT